MKEYILSVVKLLRPKHYIKNGLIFASLFFSQKLTQIDSVTSVIYGFLAFSMLASAIYVINDIRDRKEDQRHETKRTRPIASGVISVKQGIIIIVVLLFFTVILNYVSCGWNMRSYIILMLYFILNLLYSIKLKDIPLLDIAILVSGFVLRVLYGAVIIDTGVSSWLYLFVMSISFYLGLGKRRNEIIKLGDDASGIRNVLKYYNKDFLDKNMYMCLSLAVVFYSLWSTSTDVVERYGTDKVVWTVPLIILMAMKYSLTIEKGVFADPVEVILNDKVLLFLGIFYAIIMVCLVYV